MAELLFTKEASEILEDMIFLAVCKEKGDLDTFFESLLDGVRVSVGAWGEQNACSLNVCFITGENTTSDELKKLDWFVAFLKSLDGSGGVKFECIEIAPAKVVWRG